MKRRLFIQFALLALLVLPAGNLCWADVFGSGVDSFEIEFVTIGDPGNVAEGIRIMDRIVSLTIRKS